MFVLAGCSSKRTFQMEWAFTSTGACKDIGQQEITLQVANGYGGPPPELAPSAPAGDAGAEQG